MSTRDYYEVLGVPKTATAEDIKKSYRRLAMKHHPDRNSGTDAKKAEAAFKDVNEAYSTLGDETKRQAYDSKTTSFTHGKARTTKSGFGYSRFDDAWTDDYGFEEETIKSRYSQSDFDDILNNLRSQMEKNKPKVPQTVTITLEEAYNGKSVRMPGLSMLNIPAGVRSGTKLFVTGDVYIIDVQPDKKFKRTMDDLLVEVEITAIEAILGVEVKLDFLSKNQLKFDIPSGIQNGQVIRLAGYGMKNPETDKKGVLLVQVKITIPTNLSTLQKAILKNGLPNRENITI